MIITNFVVAPPDVPADMLRELVNFRLSEINPSGVGGYRVAFHDPASVAVGDRILWVVHPFTATPVSPDE